MQKFRGKITALLYPHHGVEGGTQAWETSLSVVTRLLKEALCLEKLPTIVWAHCTLCNKPLQDNLEMPLFHRKRVGVKEGR